MFCDCKNRMYSIAFLKIRLLFIFGTLLRPRYSSIQTILSLMEERYLFSITLWADFLLGFSPPGLFIHRQTIGLEFIIKGEIFLGLLLDQPWLRFCNWFGFLDLYRGAVVVVWSKIGWPLLPMVWTKILPLSRDRLQNDFLLLLLRLADPILCWYFLHNIPIIKESLSLISHWEYNRM